MEIAPSILSADFSRLGQQVGEALDAGARRIHVDVMDGHFVPSITVGPLAVRAVRPLADRYHALLDVHLMITQPERYLKDFAEAGADILTVHVEASPHLHRTIQALRALNVRVGVALNPATPLVALEEILADIDVVLIMSVDPGFGGQEFIPASLRKIARLRRMLDEQGISQIEIAVDGGINARTIVAAVRAGATIAVAGSAVFKGHASIAASIQALRAAALGAGGSS